MLTTVLVVSNVFRLSAQFNFRITGTVLGMEKGTLAFVESMARSNYIEVPFENGCFVYEGQATDFRFYNITLLEDVVSGRMRICPLILEAGETEVEITIRKGSDVTFIDLRFLKIGEMNTCLLQYISMETYFSQKYKEASNAWFSGMAMRKVNEARSDSLSQLLARNYNNVLGLFLAYFNSENYSADKVQTLLSTVPMSLRRSKYYKAMYSRFIGASANNVGSTIKNFCLPNPDNHQICLSEVLSKNNYVLLDFWGSWCGQCLERTREILPVYEKYKNHGFEIFGISLETRRENWIKRIEKEGYDWPNVCELEDGIEGDLSISNFLNPDRTVPFNMLVNGHGKVLAKNLSGDELDLILSKSGEAAR